MRLLPNKAKILWALAAALGAAALVHSTTSTSGKAPQVNLLRAPQGGIQPQTAVDARGALHMLYFTGKAAAGNLEYVRRAPGAKEFTKPLRVNSQPGSALVTGAVRGPQMAVGEDGRVYVVWFGSAQARPRGPGGSTPLLFSRLNAAGTRFEPQRNLVRYAQGLDGGLSVAAGRGGDVYVAWHARGAAPGEAHRRVYLARSSDGGKTFAREVPVSPPALGACGCCGMRAFLDRAGALFILYRAAAENVQRNMTLLVSTDRGRSFRSSQVSAWHLNACPMSTAYLSEGGGRVLAAWEKAGEVYFGWIDPRTLQISASVAEPGAGKDRKHPAVFADAEGNILLAWTEGSAWAKGGALGWQLFRPSGQPLGEEGRAPGLPAWDLPGIFAGPRGFTIVY